MKIKILMMDKLIRMTESLLW